MPKRKNRPYGKLKKKGLNKRPCHVMSTSLSAGMLLSSFSVNMNFDILDSSVWLLPLWELVSSYLSWILKLYCKEGTKALYTQFAFLHQWYQYDYDIEFPNIWYTSFRQDELKILHYPYMFSDQPLYNINTSLQTTRNKLEAEFMLYLSIMDPNIAVSKLHEANKKDILVTPSTYLDNFLNSSELCTRESIQLRYNLMQAVLALAESEANLFQSNIRYKMRKIMIQTLFDKPNARDVSEIESVHPFFLYASKYCSFTNQQVIDMKWLIDRFVHYKNRKTTCQNMMCFFSCRTDISNTDRFLEVVDYIYNPFCGSEKLKLEFLCDEGDCQTLAIMYRERVTLQCPTCDGKRPIPTLEMLECLQDRKRLDNSVFYDLLLATRFKKDNFSISLQKFAYQGLENSEDLDTAFVIAAAHGFLSLVQQFFRPSRLQCRFNEKTALFFACKYNQFDVVHWLVKEAKAELAPYDENDKTSPIDVACIYGHQRIIEFLIETQSTSTYNTFKMLRLVVRNGHVSLVRYFLKDREIVNRTDKNGHSPLWIAVSQNHLPVVKILVESKANINEPRHNDFKSLLGFACQNYDGLDVVIFLLSMGAVTSRESNHPLLFAASANSIKIMKYLIESKVDVNQMSSDSKESPPTNALRAAAVNNSCDAASLLIQHKAKVNYVDMTTYSDGKSALYRACELNNTQVAKLLLDEKADPFQPCVSGKTPHSIILELHPHSCIIDFIDPPIYDL